MSNWVIDLVVWTHDSILPILFFVLKFLLQLATAMLSLLPMEKLKTLLLSTTVATQPAAFARILLMIQIYLRKILAVAIEYLQSSQAFHPSQAFHCNQQITHL